MLGACAPSPTAPRVAPPAASSSPAPSVTTSAKPPPLPRVTWMGLGAPGDRGRSISPSGVARVELVRAKLGDEPGERSAIAIVRGAAAEARLVLDAVEAMFLGEHDLVMRRGEEVLFVDDDGLVRATVRAAWPPAVLPDGRVVLAQVDHAEVRDAKGVLAASLVGPVPATRPAAAASSGAIAVFPSELEPGPVTLFSPGGEAGPTFPEARALASRDGRTLAVLFTGWPRHRLIVFDVASRKERASAVAEASVFGLPAVAVSPDGSRVAMGFDGVLRVVDVTRGRVATHEGLPTEKGARMLATIGITERNEACLFGTDANTRRTSSCEASHLVDLATGKRTRLGPLDACVDVDGGVARLTMPAFAKGRFPVASSFFGPRGTCGLVATPDGRLAVRLEADADGRIVAIAPHDPAEKKALPEIPLRAEREEVLPGALGLSSDGSRLALWLGGKITLRDPRAGTVVAPPFESGEPAGFFASGRVVLGLFSAFPLTDRDGRALPVWPASGVTRCVDADVVVACD